MNDYNKAITEVLEILKHTDDEIVAKIPKKFMDFLTQTADEEYIPNINFTDSNWDNSIKEETKDILALIYVDYICSEEERQSFLEEEQKERAKEEELREKYNYDNLFKKRNEPEKQEDNQNNSVNNENMQLVDIRKYPWYKRVYYKILEIFGRLKK